MDANSLGRRAVTGQIYNPGNGITVVQMSLHKCNRVDY